MIESPVIAADRFPVSLLVPDDHEGACVTHPKARVILTQPDDDRGRLIAWTSPDEVVYETSFTCSSSVFGPNSQDWFVDTDLGQIIIRSLGGCGCGDRLKHWNPEQFQPYRIGRPLR